MIIETWIKVSAANEKICQILDPNGMGLIPGQYFMDFLEKLARGKLTLIQTIVSHSFAQQIVSVLESKDCINLETGEIVMTKLKKKLLDKEIDIEIFNQTLRSVAELDVPDSKPLTDFSFLDSLLKTIKDV